MTNSHTQLVEELCNESRRKKVFGFSFGAETTCCEDSGDLHSDDATEPEALESDSDETFTHQPVWEPSRDASWPLPIHSCQDDRSRGSVGLLPSVGSATHASGTCKPCSFFWQSRGCQKGLECKHCHLCPKGEYSRSKKLKNVLKKPLKMALASQQHLLPPGLDLPEALPNQPCIQLGNDGAMQVETLLCARPASMEYRPAGYSSHDIENATSEASGSAPSALFDAEIQLAACGHASSGNSSLPSIGSEAHDSGCCKPCAWFWKAEGCKNGKDCRHCHSCLPGEAKRRKALKYPKAQKTASQGLAAEVAKAQIAPLQMQEDMLHDSMTHLSFPSPRGLLQQCEEQQQKALQVSSLQAAHEWQAMLMMRQQVEILGLQLQTHQGFQVQQAQYSECSQTAALRARCALSLQLALPSNFRL